ncbi:hypothetical protein PSP6_690131 [Paraburkholderia tropica]|nr:hypothetical protein PSP6_690131 [Paraburkholderia tropica]
MKRFSTLRKAVTLALSALALVAVYFGWYALTGSHQQDSSVYYQSGGAAWWRAWVTLLALFLAGLVCFAAYRNWRWQSSTKRC